MSGPSIDDQPGETPGGPVRRVRSLIDRKLGRCGTCIRLSLALAVISWATFLTLRALTPGSVPARAALVPAVAFTALFGAHVVAFGVRVVRAMPDRAPTNPGPAEATEGASGAPAIDRRRFLGSAVKVLGLALVPTVLLSGTAMANPSCDPCHDGTCCCTHGCKTRVPKSCPDYIFCQTYCANSCFGAGATNGGQR